jgi:hypothetical protein
MKKINIAYWIVTILFCGFMIFTAIPNILVSTESVDMFSGLGYPRYLIPFLGVAKVLGGIIILIPGFNRLKEWAYAGMFFDLIGATYSALAQYGFHLPMLFMVLPISFLFISYFLWHKRISDQPQTHAFRSSAVPRQA